MYSRLSHHLHINIGSRTIRLQYGIGLHAEFAAYKGAHLRLLHCGKEGSTAKLCIRLSFKNRVISNVALFATAFTYL